MENIKEWLWRYRWIGLVLFAFIFITALLFLSNKEDQQTVVVHEDETKIELIGIRPNGGTDIYSPLTREKIDMPLPISMAPADWGGRLQLDLIFRFSNNDYPVDLRRVMKLTIPNESIGLGIAKGYDQEPAVSQDGTIAVMSILLRLANQSKANSPI